MILLFWLSLCLIFLWVWLNRRYLALYWKIGARYPALPFIGQGYLFMANREQILKNLYSVGEHAMRNGGLSAMWIMHKFTLTLADTADTEYVLKHHLEKDDSTHVLRHFTRTGSFFSEVSEWRPRRKILSELMSHKNVSKFVPVFAKESRTLVEQLRPMAGGDAFPIYPHINAYALDTICISVLGIDLNSQTNLNNPIRTAVNTIYDLASYVILRVWYHADVIIKRTTYYQQLLKHEFVIKDYIEKALKKYAEGARNDTKNVIEADDSEEPISLLQMFTRLKDQRGYDHAMLHDESVVLLMAGSESTPVSAAMVAYMVARRPDVQQKIYQELKEVLGDTDRLVTNEDLHQLKYLGAVIKETQRLYPPSPHIVRKAMEDIVLPSGVTVPKGTSMLISIYALNRNPKYWGADAEEFRPERFLDDSLDERETIFTFSTGPRACIGIQFAKMSLKTVLATLLRRYRLLPATPDAPLRFLFGLNATPVDGFRVRIEKRDVMN